MFDMIIRRALVEEILSLRHQELRKGLPPETARFDGDHESTTVHFAAFAPARPNEPICCASFMFNKLDDEFAWQLRGMATDAAHQGQGYGASLLRHAETELLSVCDDVRLLWCNARESAIGFYEKQGWECVSETFDISGAGPHKMMTKLLMQRA